MRDPLTSARRSGALPGGSGKRLGSTGGGVFAVDRTPAARTETRGDPVCVPPRTARLPSSSLHRAPRLACAASPLAVSTTPSSLSRTARHGSRSRLPGSRMPRGCAPGSFLRPHPRRGGTDAARRRAVGTRGGPGWSGVVARGWHSMRGGAARRDDCALVGRELREGELAHHPCSARLVRGSLSSYSSGALASGGSRGRCRG